MTRITKVHGPHNLDMESRKWLKTEISVSNSMDITQWFSVGSGWGHFFPLENIWQYMETLLIVMTQGGVLLASNGQRPRMLQNTHLTVHRTPPPNSYLVRNVHSAQDEKPWPNQIMWHSTWALCTNWCFTSTQKLTHGIAFKAFFFFTSGVCFAISLIKVQAFFFTYSSLSFTQVSTTGKISASTTISARSTECFATWLRAERTWRC